MPCKTHMIDNPRMENVRNCIGCKAGEEATAIHKNGSIMETIAFQRGYEAGATWERFRVAPIMDAIHELRRALRKAAQTDGVQNADE